MRSNGPCQHQRRNRTAVGGLELFRSRVKCGAGGHHIINQQHGPAGNPMAEVGRYRERAGKIPLALATAQPTLTSCCPMPDQNVGRECALSGAVA